MDTLLTLGFVFLLVCGGLLSMGNSRDGRVVALLAGGTVLGIFLIILYFVSAARRKEEERGKRGSVKRKT
jgi:hypothetical protein